MSSKLHSGIHCAYMRGGECLRVKADMMLFEVTLCDPYLSALDAFAKARCTNRRYLYIYKRPEVMLLICDFDFIFDFTFDFCCIRRRNLLFHCYFGTAISARSCLAVFLCLCLIVIIVC